MDVTVDVLHLNITPTTIQMDAETTGFAEVAKVEESLRMNKTFSGATKSMSKRNEAKLNLPCKFRSMVHRRMAMSKVAASGVNARPEKRLKRCQNAPNVSLRWDLWSWH